MLTSRPSERNLTHLDQCRDGINQLLKKRELPFALFLTLIPQILSELIPEMGTVPIPYSTRGSNSTKASTTIPLWIQPSITLPMASYAL